MACKSTCSATAFVVHILCLINLVSASDVNVPQSRVTSGSTPEPSADKEWVGCYSDDSARMFKTQLSNGKTGEQCGDECGDQGFQYFALQNGDQCFCGNGDTLGKNQYVKKPDDECGPKDSGKGGYRYGTGKGWRNAVYRTPKSSTAGPYKIKFETFSDNRFDWSDTHIDVVYPVTEDNKTFPLISYSHGFSNLAQSDYHSLFHTLASWGYVVVAPRTCRYGCLTSWNCKSLKGDPICFGDYYKMQLLAIEWAKEGSAKLPINFAVGVGVAGHSMGGQATLYSAAQGAESHDIRAAALHHPFTHSFPSIQKVPFLVFTSTNDTVASPNMSQQIFNAAGAYPVRGLVERVDNPADPDPHGEPDKWGSNNSGIKWFTVAWFKVHLDKTPKAHGVDFEALVYGKGTDSLCHGGDGPMATCSLLRGAITSDSEGMTVIV